MRRSLKLSLMLIALAVLAGAAWLLWGHGAAEPRRPQAQAAGDPSGREAAGDESGNRKGEAQPVPVFVATAEAKDVPIILRGIGSVQAFNTVTVRSRVDGNIVKVGFTEGQFVHAGDVLVQIDPRPYQAQLQQANANLAKDEANLANARLDLARYAALLPQGFAPRQQYDTQRALVAQLEATVQSDRAVIETARLNVSYSGVTSPIDGVTGLRLVDIGNLVQASTATPLVVVTQIRPIYVTFTIPERDLERIRRAIAGGSLPVLVFDGDDKQQLSAGVLKLVNNTVDQATGTVTLKAEFANADAALWPGQFVNAHLVVEAVKNGVTIPAGAVQMGPQGAFAYVVKDGRTVEARPVTVTQIESGNALLGKGLAAGDRVVVSGQVGLSPGAKVAVQEGAPGELTRREPEVGPEGVGSSGTTSGPAGGINPR